MGSISKFSQKLLTFAKPETPLSRPKVDLRVFLAIFHTKPSIQTKVKLLAKIFGYQAYLALKKLWETIYGRTKILQGPKTRRDRLKEPPKPA